MKIVQIHLPGFEKTSLGEPLELWALENDHGMIATFSNYGPSMTTLFVPDKRGMPTNIVLGRNTIQAYEQVRTLGRIGVGQYAGPIVNATYVQPDDTNPDVAQGQEVHLHADKPPHMTHGGEDTWMNRIWRVDNPKKNDASVSIQFKLHDPHMGLHGRGLPGNIDASIQVTLTNHNSLQILYTATTDRTTPIMMTNHSYFNLNGTEVFSTIKDHVIAVNADRYIEIGENDIPTGTIKDIAGTPFDFSAPISLSTDFLDKPLDICLLFQANAKHELTLTSSETGIEMYIQTDQPAVQVYNGCHLKPPFQLYEGICLEPQYPIAYVNNPQWSALFGDPFVKNTVVYMTQTEYSFFNT